MKTIVIYHSADYDGIFCREVARKFLGDKDVEYVGWNFGDAPLTMPKGIESGNYVVMDLPIDKVFGIRFKDGWIERDRPGFPTEVNQVQPLDRVDWSNFVWIDHHKTSIDTHPKDIPGYRIDGVAACRLAWQWFSSNPGPTAPGTILPTKEEFLIRAIKEPLAVRLAGEYDIWDKRDPRAETFQYALRTRDLSKDDWGWLLTVADGNKLGEYELGMADVTVLKLIQDGDVAQAYAQRTNASICNHLTWLMEWEGLKFLCVNHTRFNSLLFAAKDVPETGHDALLGFMFNGKSWLVSLYHANHRKDIDLSEIAKKYGGGGHRGACGFTCDKLPFLL